MGPYEQLLQALNFMAPAWCLAIWCALCARAMGRLGLPRAAWSFRTQVGVNGFIGLAVLLGGLALWGVDGKMVTWGILVLVSASTQWLMCQAWRR
jgi:hypothetical protein